MAVIEELRKDKDINWQISWVGARKSIEGMTQKPFDYDLFPTLGVSVYAISAAKLQSKFTRNTIPALLRLPMSFIQAFQTLGEIKPDVILSFGGSAALPITFWGWVKRIPVVLHEQTVTIGLSNKISSRFANKIALARESSLNYYPKDKCVITGNPLMNSILELSNFKISGKKLFIVGGSRGSQNLNEVVFKALPKLLALKEIIHQTGELDFDKALKLKASLKPSLSAKYTPYKFINPQDIGSIYKEVFVMVARAGANTVSEAMALGIPTIFIPIPWTRMDEQNKNALFAKEKGIAEVVSQYKLTPETLVTSVEMLIKDSSSMKTVYEKNKFNDDLNARKKIRNLLLSFIS